MHAYIYPQHLKDEMKETFPDGKPFNAAFMHVQLAKDSKQFELIIPHEDVRKQGYVINILAHKTTKVSYHNFFCACNASMHFPKKQKDVSQLLLHERKCQHIPVNNYA